MEPKKGKKKAEGGKGNQVALGGGANIWSRCFLGGT